MPILQHTKNGQFILTLPHELCKLKGWKGGETLAIVFNENGDLLIKKVDE